MEQLEDSDGNGHGHNNSINHFSPLFESYDEEGTKHRTKPKTPIIVLSEDEKEKNKGEQNEDNEENEDDHEKKKPVKTDDPASDVE